MKSNAVILSLIAGGLLNACEPASQSKDVARICAQATEFIERNLAEYQQPRDWNRLMTASSRLVYMANHCGGLVTEPHDVLCASLSNAIERFATNPQVPPGPNRDGALSVANQTYSQSGCAD